MAGGGEVRKLRVDMAEETADQALAGKQLTDEIPDVTHLDLCRFDIRVDHRLAQGFGEHIEDRQTLALPVAGKIGLTAPQYVDIGCPLHIVTAPAGR